MVFICWTDSGKYEVKLYQEGRLIKSEVTQMFTKIKVISFAIGLGLNKFFMHFSSSESVLRRFFQVDQATLRVAYGNGLQGGGVLCSKDPTNRI